ncbi:MAG TPA: copper chaperone [Alphaproteobacteria bacterium]|nr:copper chaperone [Alphaproteobacteria bacterium]
MLKFLQRIAFVLALTTLGVAPALLGATSAFAAAANAAKSANSAGSHVYKLYVDGLACPFCAYGVEKQVSGLAGVKNVDINIDSGLVAVTMAPGASLDKATAKQAVSDAGFSLRKFEGAKGK